MEVWIGPASEALPKIGERVAEKLRTLDLAACHPPARIEFEREIAQLAIGSGCRNLEWFIPYLYSQPGCLIDYLPAAAKPWLIVEDTGELMAALSDLEGQAEQGPPGTCMRRATCLPCFRGPISPPRCCASVSRPTRPCSWATARSAGSRRSRPTRWRIPSRPARATAARSEPSWPKSKAVWLAAIAW